MTVVVQASGSGFRVLAVEIVRNGWILTIIKNISYCGKIHVT